jgi:hypothetical protein
MRNSEIRMLTNQVQKLANTISRKSVPQGLRERLINEAPQILAEAEHYVDTALAAMPDKKEFVEHWKKVYSLYDHLNRTQYDERARLRIIGKMEELRRGW